MTSKRALVAKALVLVAFLAASAGVFLHYYFYTGNLSHNGRYRVQAVVPDAGGLAQSAKVTAAGIEVGKVRRIARRGGNAVLELAIDDEYAPVYRNATVRIRERTPAVRRDRPRWQTRRRATPQRCPADTAGGRVRGHR